MRSCFGTPQDLDQLRVFGCLCFVSTLQHNRSKFDTKAIPQVFIGYPSGTKGYKVLNPKTMVISVSRDVVFHEQHSPYRLQHNSKPCAFFLSISTDINPISFEYIPDIFHPPLTVIEPDILHVTESNDNLTDLSPSSSSTDQSLSLRKSTR